MRLFGEQVQKNAGIEVTRACAHHEATGGCKSHRRIDTDSATHSRHARPVPKVRDEDTAVGLCGRDGVEFLHDVLIGQPVKPETDHTLVAETPGQRVNLREARHAPVKLSVEACHLRDVWKGPDGGLDRQNGLGQMIGRERHQFLESRNQFVGDADGLPVVAAPLHHTVPNREEAQIRTIASQPCQNRF